MPKKKKIEEKKVQNEEPLNENVMLNKEQRLEVLVSHLEVDLIKKDIQAIHNKAEFLEREKMICNLKISDLKSKLTRKQLDHKDIIDQIGRQIGVDLKNSVINQETGEINFV